MLFTAREDIWMHLQWSHLAHRVPLLNLPDLKPLSNEQRLLKSDTSEGIMELVIFFFILP